MAGESFAWNYDRSELIADGIVHGVGVVLALAGAVALVACAAVWSSGGVLAAVSVYGAGLVLALGISCAYNVWPVSAVKWRLRRFDHASIFVLIAATYTPFLQRGVDEPVLAFMLVAIWVAAIAGAALKFLLPGRFDRLAILLYLLMGWSGVLAAEPLASRLPAITMLLILAGGVLYSVGVVFHVWERLRFQNAIWHGFVVAAAATHYSAVLASIVAGGPDL